MATLIAGRRTRYPKARQCGPPPRCGLSGRSEEGARAGQIELSSRLAPPKSTRPAVSSGRISPARIPAGADRDAPIRQTGIRQMRPSAAALVGRAKWADLLAGMCQAQAIPCGRSSPPETGVVRPGLRILLSPACRPLPPPRLWRYGLWRSSQIGLPRCNWYNMYLMWRLQR